MSSIVENESRPGGGIDVSLTRVKVEGDSKERGRGVPRGKGGSTRVLRTTRY